MGLIGALAVIFLYWCILHYSVTGRWAFIALAVWSLPCIGAAYFVPEGTEINGLVMLICLIAMFTEALAYSRVKMWNVNARRTKKYVMGIFYMLSLMFVAYCVIESQRFGYIPNIMGIGEEGSFSKFCGWIIILVINIPATEMFVCVIDRFFSNKKNFVIIRCETFIAGTLGKFDENLLKNRYLCGINNGQEYYFGITDKAYILLKDVSTCRLSIKKGVLGGLYITKYPDGMDKKLAEKADRWLFKKGVMATAIFAVVVAVIMFV